MSNCNQIEFLSLKELKEKALASQGSPLVTGMIDAGSLVIMAGSSKAGKTALVTNLAFSVATGTRFLDMETAQGPVLWVTYEESPAERWLHCKHYSEDAPIHHLQNPSPIDTKAGIEHLRLAIESSSAKLVVIDPLVAAVSCDNLMESVKARKALAPINQLRIDTGVTVLVMHHQNKGAHAGDSPDKMSDSHQIASACTQFWNLRYIRKAGSRIITMAGRGRHENGDRVWKITSADNHTFRLMSDQEVSEARKSKTSMASEIISAMSPDILYTSESLGEITGMKVASIRNRMKQLVEEKQICQVRVSGKKGLSYRLSSASDAFLDDAGAVE